MLHIDMVRRKSKKRGPVQAKKISYDGIKFASGLERYTYIALKKSKLFEGYENQTFELITSFQFPNTSYEKQANGKGESVSYTHLTLPTNREV